MKIRAKRQVRNNFDYFPIGRIVGGFAWPGEKPGFAVVLGEEQAPEIGDRTVYHMHLLDTAEDMDVHKLIEAAAVLASRFKFHGYYGRRDTWGMATMRFREDQRLPTVNIGHAQFSEGGKIRYHADKLKVCLMPNAKTLHGIEGTSLQGYLEMVEPEEYLELSEEKHPALAALGYAVDFLTSYPPDWDEQYYVSKQTVRDADKVTGY